MDPNQPARGVLLLVRMFLTTAAVALSSYACVVLSIERETFFSPIWPASGLAFAAVLFWGPWMIPAIYAGVAICNALWDFTAPLTWIGPFGIIFEAVGTLWLLTRWLGPRPRLTDLRSALAFLAAPWLPVAINSMFGCFLLYLGGDHDPARCVRESPLFIAANGSTIVLIGSALAAWTTRPDAAWWRRFIVLAAITLASAGWLLLADSPVTPYALVLPLLAAAIMLGVQGTAVLLLACALLAIGAALESLGPLAAGGRAASFLPVYSWLAVMTLASLPVAATLGAHRTRWRTVAAGAKSAQLVFWSWHHDAGVQVETGTEACPLDARRRLNLEPSQLFRDDSAEGLLETMVDDRPLLSSWIITDRDAAGWPVEARGLLFDLSARLSLEKARQQAWQSEIELRNIRASLTPHLLFNCLAAVRGIVRSDPDRARAFIDHLARFLRDSTNMQSRETVPLLDEWQLCEDFLALQAMRYERDLPRLVEIEGSAYQGRLPPMMLLNLVENAVKHGRIDQQYPLRLRARLADGRLHVTIVNHGPLGPSPVDRPGGLGIARARLTALYGTDASLDIRQEGGEVIAAMTVPATPDHP